MSPSQSVAEIATPRTRILERAYATGLERPPATGPATRLHRAVERLIGVRA